MVKIYPTEVYDMINCAEKCIHEDDGLCGLKEVRKPSSTPIKDCPYFESREKEKPLNPEA